MDDFLNDFQNDILNESNDNFLGYSAIFPYHSQLELDSDDLHLILVSKYYSNSNNNFQTFKKYKRLLF